MEPLDRPFISGKNLINCGLRSAGDVDLQHGVSFLTPGIIQSDVNIGGSERASESKPNRPTEKNTLNRGASTIAYSVTYSIVYAHVNLPPFDRTREKNGNRH